MNGVIIVDKPAGWTSHDVVNRMRRILQQRSVGISARSILSPPASSHWSPDLSPDWRSSTPLPRKPTKA
jgi:hypothetical protein